MAEATTTQVRRVSHITLIVTDPDRSVEFYRKAFGAEVRGDEEFDFGGQTMRWITVGIPGDDLEISIQPPMAMEGQQAPEPGDGNMTVAEVVDVDAATETFEAAGGSIVSAPEDLPWGRSAVVRDPDGNPWNLVAPNV